MERNVALQEVQGAPTSINGQRNSNSSSSSSNNNNNNRSFSNFRRTPYTSKPSTLPSSSDVEKCKKKSTRPCSAIAGDETTTTPTKFWGKENTTQLIDDSPSLSWSSASSSSNNDDDVRRKVEQKTGCHLKPQSLLQLLEETRGNNSVSRELAKVNNKMKHNLRSVMVSSKQPSSLKTKKDKTAAAFIKKSVEVCVDGADKIKQQVVLNYLNALQDNLHLRTKTHVQLTVQNKDDDDDFCQVIVSGSTDLHKLGQLLTFLTSGGGAAAAVTDDDDDGNYYQQELTPPPTYHHRQRRRRSQQQQQQQQHQQQRLMKNNTSWFSLLVGDETGANIGVGNSKTMKHICIENGQTLILDKSIKIVQIFQGLVMSSNSGMVWDSVEAKEMGTYYNSLIWRKINNVGTQDANTYYIVIDGILANQSVPDYKHLPLPRLVDENCFGQNAMELNWMLHHRWGNGSDEDDDIVPSFSTTGSSSTSAATTISSSQIINIFDDEESIRMLDPICYADGTVNITDEPYATKSFFSTDKVASAGPPNQGVPSTMINKKKNPATVDN